MIGSLKLDGLRVICEVIVDEEEVNFLSRTGNPITSLDHLKPAMLELGKLSGHKHIFFDGEGTAGSFNQSVSALRKKERAGNWRYLSYFRLLPTGMASTG